MSAIKKTPYRLYPLAESHQHYTAVTYADDMLQVKPIRKSFETIQDWINDVFAKTGTKHLEGVKLTSEEYGGIEEDANDIIDEMEMRDLVDFPNEKAVAAHAKYTPSTLLRFYPEASEEHFTGVYLESGAVLQVKPFRKAYPSVAEWLSILPGSPSENQLDVEMKEPSKAPSKPAPKTGNKRKANEAGCTSCPNCGTKVKVTLSPARAARSHKAPTAPMKTKAIRKPIQMEIEEPIDETESESEDESEDESSPLLESSKKAPAKPKVVRPLNLRELKAYSLWENAAARQHLKVDKTLVQMAKSGVDEDNEKHMVLCRILAQTKLNDE